MQRLILHKQLAKKIKTEGKQVKVKFESTAINPILKKQLRINPALAKKLEPEQLKLPHSHTQVNLKKVPTSNCEIYDRILR